MKDLVKVHRIVCFIVDHVPAPRVVSIDSAEIEWGDDHPINSAPSSRRAKQAYENLFNRKGEWTV